MSVKAEAHQSLDEVIADEDYELFKLDTKSHVAYYQARICSAMYMSQRSFFDQNWRLVKIENSSQAYAHGFSRDGSRLVHIDDIIRPNANAV